MRLWHKDLIPVLPRQQLLAQWRECCCIAKNIAEKGTPNHILVNKVKDYPYYEFCAYTRMVAEELVKRGYNIDFTRFTKYGFDAPEANATYQYGHIFAAWHNDRYLLQCYYNLQEKYDCGGITEDEWMLIDHQFSDKFLVHSVKQKIGHVGLIDEIDDESITIIDNTFYKIGDIN